MRRDTPYVCRVVYGPNGEELSVGFIERRMASRLADGPFHWNGIANCTEKQFPCYWNDDRVFLTLQDIREGYGDGI